MQAAAATAAPVAQSENVPITLSKTLCTQLTSTPSHPITLLWYLTRSKLLELELKLSGQNCSVVCPANFKGTTNLRPFPSLPLLSLSDLKQPCRRMMMMMSSSSIFSSEPVLPFGQCLVSDLVVEGTVLFLTSFWMLERCNSIYSLPINSVGTTTGYPRVLLC